MDITGIILAGGKSSRLGFNKLDLMINRIPLFIDLASRLGYFCNDIIISTSQNNISHVKSVIEKLADSESLSGYFTIKMPPPRIVIDIAPVTEEAGANLKITGSNNNGFTGALKGIYSSLLAAENEYSIVVASDMPFISCKLLDFLSNKISASSSSQKTDMILVKNVKGYEMLCSVYSKKCAGYIKINISKGIFKITSLLPFVKAEIVSQDELDSNGIDMLNFFNINTKNDYNDFNNKLKDIKENIKKSPHPNFAGAWQDFFYR